MTSFKSVNVDFDNPTAGLIEKDAFDDIKTPPPELYNSIRATDALKQSKLMSQLSRKSLKQIKNSNDKSKRSSVKSTSDNESFVDDIKNSFSLIDTTVRGSIEPEKIDIITSYKKSGTTKYGEKISLEPETEEPEVGEHEEEEHESGKTEEEEPEEEEHVDKRLSNRDPFSMPREMSAQIGVIKKLTDDPVLSVTKPSVKPKNVKEDNKPIQSIKFTAFTKGVANNGQGIWSVVITDPNNTKVIDGFFDEEPANNGVRMEIKAILELLKYANEYFPRWSMLIYTDDDNIRNILDNITNREEKGKWIINYNKSPIPSWKKNNWKKKPASNKDLWKEIDKEIVNGYQKGSQFVMHLSKGHQKTKGYIEAEGLVKV